MANRAVNSTVVVGLACLVGSILALVYGQIGMTLGRVLSNLLAGK